MANVLEKEVVWTLDQWLDNWARAAWWGEPPGPTMPLVCGSIEAEYAKDPGRYNKNDDDVFDHPPIRAVSPNFKRASFIEAITKSNMTHGGRMCLVYKYVRHTGRSQFWIAQQLGYTGAELIEKYENDLRVARMILLNAIRKEENGTV